MYRKVESSIGAPESLLAPPPLLLSSPVLSSLHPSPPSTLTHRNICGQIILYMLYPNAWL